MHEHRSACLAPNPYHYSLSLKLAALTGYLVPVIARFFVFYILFLTQAARTRMYANRVHITQACAAQCMKLNQIFSD